MISLRPLSITHHVYLLARPLNSSSLKLTSMDIPLLLPTPSIQNSAAPSASSSPSKNPSSSDSSSNQSSGSNPSNSNQPSNSASPSPTNSPSTSPDNSASSSPGNSASGSGNSPSPSQSTAAASASPSPSPSPSSSQDSASPSAPTPSPSPSPSSNSQNSNNGQKNDNGQKNSNSQKPDNSNNNNKSGNNAPNISTITSTYDAPGGQPSANAQRNIAAPTSSPQSDNSSGLSSGAITAIAVIAGIVGFILLFWVGVQMLQSKRRRREEAEMQEIDFDPHGNGSINGDNPFPRPSAALERQPSSLNGSSVGYSKGGPAHYGDPMYGDDMRMREEAEYVDPHVNSEYDGNLQRQPTLGASSAYSGGAISSQAPPQPYYSNGIPRQPAPYANYTPYAGQYGAPPPPPPAQNFDYGHRRFDSNNGPSTIEYHHYGESRDGPGHSVR